MKKSPLIIPLASAALVAVAAILGTTSEAQAQTDVIYSYSGLTGELTGTYTYSSPGFASAVGTNAPTELNGQNWADLINSGRAWGTGHSSLVRNFDWAEDNQVDYLTTGATDGAATWYYSTNANTNAQSGTPARTTFSGGTFNGQNILGNSAVIAVYDDQVVLYNSAASSSTALSLYSVNTGAVTLSNFGFAALSGGEYDGLTIAQALSHLIGAEDGQLFFLNSDGSSVAYAITTGVLSSDVTWTTLSGGGVVSGGTLTAALDSGYYLGMGAGSNYGDYYFVGTVIPEPSSVALIIGGVASVTTLLRRRRVASF